MMLVPMTLKGLADLAFFMKLAFEANAQAYDPVQMRDLKPDSGISPSFFGEHSAKASDA